MQSLIANGSCQWAYRDIIVCNPEFVSALSHTLSLTHPLFLYVSISQCSISLCITHSPSLTLSLFLSHLRLLLYPLTFCLFQFLSISSCLSTSPLSFSLSPSVQASLSLSLIDFSLLLARALSLSLILSL